mgnify:CR=1 FL=1
MNCAQGSVSFGARECSVVVPATSSIPLACNRRQPVDALGQQVPAPGFQPAAPHSHHAPQGHRPTSTSPRFPPRPARSLPCGFSVPAAHRMPAGDPGFRRHQRESLRDSRVSPHLQQGVEPPGPPPRSAGQARGRRALCRELTERPGRPGLLRRRTSPLPHTGPAPGLRPQEGGD